MKKLKVKLEYSFEVPEDTRIIEDEYHGLFIVNEKHGVNYMPSLKGRKLDFVRFGKYGEFHESSMSDDNGELRYFLYEHPKSEKTTINLGKEKYQYIITTEE
jgi:hypothetical protein